MLTALALGLLVINIVGLFVWPGYITASLLLSIILFLLVLQFFRNPERLLPTVDQQLVYAPADGKVVVIEEAFEPEYLQEKRLQISIFMSPVNVHVNRNPVGGEVEYVRHHPGRYLVAWHPKSSTENERTTTVINTGQTKILMRQIAGAMAKRIVNYLNKGDRVQQGADMGFIKFGSRVDVFLPLDAEVEVSMGQKVKGNHTVLARLKK